MINKIIQGDCLEVMKDIPDKSVDMILTDPPYGINYQSNMRVVSKKFNRLANDNNDMRFLSYPEIYRVLKDNCVAIIFCSFKNYADDYNEIKKLFSIKNTIIWFKGGGGIGDLRHSLSTDYEMAIVAHKGMCNIRGKRDGSVWQHKKVNPNKMIHATEKPTDLFERLILKFSDEGQIILDPFAGSGVTGIAAINTNRNYILIEKEPEYIDIINKRLML